MNGRVLPGWLSPKNHDSLSADPAGWHSPFRNHR
jgi:hypothetical protein